MFEGLGDGFVPGLCLVLDVLNPMVLLQPPILQAEKQRVETTGANERRGRAPNDVLLTNCSPDICGSQDLALV